MPYLARAEKRRRRHQGADGLSFIMNRKLQNPIRKSIGVARAEKRRRRRQRAHGLYFNQGPDSCTRVIQRVLLLPLRRTVGLRL